LTKSGRDSNHDHTVVPFSEAAVHLLLVDDHTLFRDALRRVLQLGFPEATIRETSSIEGAIDDLSQHPEPDLVILDLTMRGVRGFEGFLTVRSRFPRIPILICSGVDEPRIIREALALGAAGFVAKTARQATYHAAVKQALEGQVFVPEGVVPLPPEAGQRSASARISTLSQGQLNVLILIKKGLTNQEIAARLGIGMSMVKTHATEIMRKLGVRTRTQAVIFVSELDFEHAGLRR
jgi:DNA-binding NarL/FixJ family response regulator